MLNWLYTQFGSAWGPLRLFDSYFFLASAGVLFAAMVAWIALPLLSHRLPKDQGRAFAVNAEASIGKPLSAGIIYIPVFILTCLLFLPLESPALWTLPFVFLAMLVGYFDDRKQGGLSELTLGTLDLALAFGTSAVMLWGHPTELWLPVVKTIFVLPAWAAIILSTGVIWLAINAMNCSDGVDGVSGSLAAISTLMLGGLLYATVGNEITAAHLSLPFQPEGANWSIFALALVGTLCGYLWHNAPPSALLMGDAGSRPNGLILGILVTATQNPTLIVVIGLVILANGATGLLKVALKRFFGIGILSTIRFPLHDHCRKVLNWSNAQVLVRFVLLHIGISALLIVMSLKIR
jgi:phospho-N-acetylmuramoyl-pentapeptide-transferase